MTKILGIETSTKVCSVALIDEDEISGEITLNIPHIHVEQLVVMINNLLSNLHLSYGDLDAVGVSSGPGSFTGLRIGLSVAKGIAFALDKKLIAVPTLDAIAYAMYGFGDRKTIVPILHARAEEFYYASFKLEGKELTLTRAYKSGSAEEIASEFADGQVHGFAGDTILIGEGIQKFSKHVQADSFEKNAKASFVESTLINLPASARNVAFLAARKFKINDFADLKSLVPLYVKDFVALKKNSFRNLSSLKSGV